MAGEPVDVVVVGHVRRAHGVRGEVVVEALSDDPDRFGPGATMYVERGGDRELLTVRSVRPHRGVLLVCFEGIEDRDRVESLRGRDLVVDAAQVGEAPDGAYYYFDLVGRSCVDRQLGALGEVVAVREDGGGLLLEVRDDRRTLLVPFVREYLVAVDAEEKSIEVDLPAGLVETCTSPS